MSADFVALAAPVVLTRFRHLGNKVAPSTCSEIFCNMLALARRSDIDLYSMSSFLLNFHEPTATISIPCENSTISLLKRVRVGEHIGSGRGSGIIEGKEYLVAGTQSGDVFIIDSPFVALLLVPFMFTASF
jgi:hypothetical protein